MQYLSCFDANFVLHLVGNGLARSACGVYLRIEIGASCLPLAELEGKVLSNHLPSGKHKFI